MAPSRKALHWRPRHRGECIDGPRPCPFVGCRYHLFADVSHAGMLRLRGKGTQQDLEAMAQTCALDVADAGRMTLEEIGSLLGVHRERIRQIEEGGLRKLRRVKGEALRLL